VGVAVVAGDTEDVDQDKVDRLAYRTVTLVPCLATQDILGVNVVQISSQTTPKAVILLATTPLGQGVVPTETHIIMSPATKLAICRILPTRILWSKNPL
jgi:hypothetical protein